MHRVGLHQYLKRIGNLVEENRLPEAAAHCHYILQQYPRHLETYRLLGRVLLEQQLSDDAIDIFERVLSVDPEDLVAHAGMAVAYKDKLDLQQATWHMERAFELKPYDQLIRAELLQFYATRDGYTRQKLELTEAGLARLYYRGGLYRRAEIELNKLIARNPERVDLKVLQAKTLFWAGKQLESVRVCHELLDDVPYCLVANVIVGYALNLAGRDEQARPYLDRAFSLILLSRDQLKEDSIIGLAFLQGRGYKLPESIVVEELDEAVTVGHEADQELNWLDSRSLEHEEITTWLDEIIVPDTLEEMDEIEETGRVEPSLAQWFDEGETENQQDVDLGVGEGSPISQEEQLENDLLELVGEFDEGDEVFGSGSTTLEQEPFETDVGDFGQVEAFDFDFEDATIEPLVDDELDVTGESSGESVDDELWADALDEFSSLVEQEQADQRAIEPEFMEQTATLENEEEDWFDEVTIRKNVTDELPGWLLDSIESTPLEDEPPASLEEAIPSNDALPSEGLDAVNDQENGPDAFADFDPRQEERESGLALEQTDERIDDSSPSWPRATGESNQESDEPSGDSTGSSEWLADLPGESALWLAELEQMAADSHGSEDSGEEPDSSGDSSPEEDDK